MNWDVWGPPLVVVGVGAGIGSLVAWRSVKAGRTSRSAAGENLSARKEQLMEALRELDADRSKQDEATWSARREALLAEASDTLRALELGPSTPEPETTPVRPAPAPARRAVWALGTVGFFALLAGGLAVSTSQRGEGQSMTGGMDRGEDELAAEAEAAKQTLASNPDDLDALNTLTWYNIRSRDLSGAMETLERARTVAPGDPLVLTHLAVLEIQIGMLDRAEESLQQALSVNPNLPRALLFSGLVKLQQEDRPGAAAALEKVLAGKLANNEERQMAASLLAEAKAAPAQDRIKGGVALAEGVSAPPGASLFVIARRSAEGGGPPVAALRLSATVLPTAFTITDKNMMLGGDWPDQVWIQARVDADGNPTTKGEGDIESAVIGPLASGAADVQLVIGGTVAASGGAAPTEAAPTDSPAPAASTADFRLKGQLTLTEGLSAPAGGVLFVIARRAAEGGGPPVAALRLPTSSFPLDFSLSDADMMMGGTWPDQVWLQARIDADGNPSTKGDGDVLSAVLGPLSPGTADLKLVLGAAKP